MPRGRSLLKISKWRLFFTLLVLGASIYVVTQSSVRLGLDLQGGTQIVLEAQERAREIVCTAIPEQGLKKYRLLAWFPYHGLSRARNGKNCPVARSAVYDVLTNGVPVEMEVTAA
mgnify:CR=1 FL=1